MRITIFSLFFVLITMDASLAGGSYVGNGGDTIVCKASPENSFVGHYTLDYLLEYRETTTGPVAVTSFSQTILRLERFLGEKYPELLEHFKQFMAAVRADRPMYGRHWMEDESGLIDIKDENIQKLIPKNCMGVVQTVIRESITDPIIYHYDRKILEELEVKNSLQYSFFIVHEWLWDLTRDVRSVRKLNWLFHDPQLEKIKRSDLSRIFNQLDVFKVKLSFCERSTQIKNLFPVSCEQVQLNDLSQVTELNLSKMEKKSQFRMGDFYGFGRVQKLSLRGLELTNYDLLPRLFFPLYTLKKLDLSHNKLSNLSDELLVDLGDLESLDISYNEFSTFPESFGKLEELESLTISNFSFGKDAFNNLPPKLTSLTVLASNNDSKEKIEELLKAIKTIRPNLSVIIQYDL